MADLYPARDNTFSGNVRIEGALTLPNGERDMAEDAAVAIDGTDTFIHLNSASGAKAITTVTTATATTPAVYAGQRVMLLMDARSGGSYTLTSLGGELTFDAAAERAEVVRDGTNTAWVPFIPSVGAATVV
jgi:hypothetical protein